MKKIALCRVGKKTIPILEQYGGCHILRFFDERKRWSHEKLAYYLGNDPSVNFAVVGYSVAEGLAPCHYLPNENIALPSLSLCERRDFMPKARRLGVNFYGTGPPALEWMIPLILRQHRTIHVCLTSGHIK